MFHSSTCHHLTIVADLRAFLCSFWILLWLDGFCLLVLIFFFPETSSENILFRRAKRLREKTGNQNLRSEGEIQMSQMKPKDIVLNTVGEIALFAKARSHSSRFILFSYGCLCGYLSRSPSSWP